jgi:muramoyltetrapeptide carboxypeptidase
MIGRSNGKDAKADSDLNYLEALQSVLQGMPYPVIYDTDIGHVQPQMTLINGALATVHFHASSQERCSISQQLY